MSPARVNPNGNYELQAIMTCQAGSLIVTNVPLWWGMLIIGLALYAWGQGRYGKSLKLPLSFAVNLKLL